MRLRGSHATPPCNANRTPPRRDDAHRFPATPSPLPRDAHRYAAMPSPPPRDDAHRVGRRCDGIVPMGVVLACFVAAAMGCTYSASFTDCAVSCRAADQCPDGFACGSEGFCRAPASRGSCSSVRGDAGLGGGDGTSSARCSGAAVVCDTFVPMLDCLDQDGCTYTTSKCTLTTNCSLIQTNQQCMATPGCATDIPTSTCKPVAGYCHGSTKSACEAIQSCAYSGGCAGTPQACTTYPNESGCRTQGGCDWN